MKLRRIAIERMPGIDRPFEIGELGAGLHILVGPNGIGKSRLCAAVRALLWPEAGIEGNSLTARGSFEHQNEQWQVVRDGSLHRWQRGGIDAIPPTLPGERLSGCFFLSLRDLLDDSDRAGRDLASEIRRQMSGGFDLDAVEQGIEASVPVRAGRNENKELTSAERAIRQAEKTQRDIELREQQLQSLTARAEQAQDAGRRLAPYARALELHATRRDHAQCLDELDQLPEALADLDGRESEKLDTLDETLSQKRSTHEKALHELKGSQERAEATRLDEPLDAATLAAWGRRAEKLAEFERQLDTARENAEAAESAAQESRRALGVRGDRDPAAANDSGISLTVDDDADLFAFLRENQQLTTRREALQERLQLLSAREMSEAAAQRLDLLRRGVGPLRDWLRAPDPAREGREVRLWPSRTLLLVAAVVLIAMGLVAQFVAPASGFGMALLGIGVGLGTAGLLARVQQDRQDATDWRAVAERQFPERLDPPASWSQEAVDECLRHLEEEVAKLDAEKTRARDRAVERGTVDESLRALGEAATDLAAHRQRLAERIGLDEQRLDIEIVDAARVLAASQRAHTAARAAITRVEVLEGECQTRGSEIGAFLRERGESEACDSASARAGVESLKERDRSLRSARNDAASQQRSLDLLDRDIETHEAQRAALFRTAGVAPDDRMALTRCLLELPRYRDLCRKRDEGAAGIRRIERELDEAGETALAGLDEARLTAEAAQLTERTERVAELNREIGEIQLSARNAREGHVLEEAIATRSAVLGKLHDRRDEALAAAAGSFLIDAVRHEHETNQMPRVLERARGHFGTFTHHRYELKVAPSDDGSFVALDARIGAGLTPDQLSDGTRAQLILAARLAFAEEAEQGAELPLFLDEALDHSDPERFHAIARSLARMVLDDDRQIFYLTNDPTDVDRFRSAFAEEGCSALHPLDLGAIRGLAARAEGPDALQVAPLPAVPSPDASTAEQYGAAIGVAPLDPGGDIFGHSLYYVLRDDLALLHGFLEARIETLGQCHNLLAGRSALAASMIEGSQAGAVLKDRIALFETFCITWREGRGEKVGRPQIEQSDAVSDNYLEAVVAIASEQGGDPAQLMASLRLRDDPRLRGYRTRAADELEQFFVEQGFIDERPILSEDGILERAIGTPAANQLQPAFVAELVHLWWELSSAAT